MTKILFIGVPLSGNLGGHSLLISTCKVLKTFIPDAEFKLLSTRPEQDFEQASRHPDTAFVLDPAPIETVNMIMLQEKLDKKPLIGIVASRQVERFIERLYAGDIKSQNKYTTILAQITDHLIEKLNALVVFIPNDIAQQKGRYDDIYTAKKAYEMIKNKSEVRLITTEYQAQELKGIIGKCDLVITSRYHSTVAALSMCVPCLVIGWGFKYDQVREIMREREFVCNFETMTLTEVQAKVNKLWHDREKVKVELASRMPSIEQSVLSGSELVTDLLDTHSETKQPYRRD